MEIPDQRTVTRCVDVSVEVPLLMSHPKSALLGVLQLLEGWQSVIEDDVSVEQFSGAMTNMVYRCGLLQGGREVQVVLMRVHASSSDLFDRQAEIDTFKGVSQAGLGPHLLLLFKNGRVEEFLGEHVTLAAADIHDPAVSAAIAATLATFHTKMSKVMGGTKHQVGPVQLWERLRLWLDLVQQVTTMSELQQLGMAELDQEIIVLEQQLKQQHPCWVALCHNDLQYGNIMAHVGAATVSADGTAAAAAAPADDQAAPAGAGNGNHSSLTEQLKALGLKDGASAAVAAAAAAVGYDGGDSHGADAWADSAAGAASLGLSPRQRLLQPAGVPAAAAGGGVLAAGLAPVRQAGPESRASDDTSLSNVSVAGSTAPSVSGLSVMSGTTAAPLPAQAAPAAAAPAAVLNTRVSEVSASASSSSLQVLGRSPHRTVQLPDGSLVLPGMRARPRGQSPEPARGKRPDMSSGSFTGSLGGASMQNSGQWAALADSAAAGSGLTGSAPAAGAVGSFSGSRLCVPPQLQPPSAAAVLRHAESVEGDLLLQLMPEGPEAVAEAGLTRRHRICHAESASGANHHGSASDSDSSSSTSSSATTSAADSAEAEDLLLVPQHLQRQQGQGAAVAGVLACERDAAVSRSARRYREVRRARLQPAEGLEFPTLITSDADSGSNSDDSSSFSDDSTSRNATARHSRGRSPPSRFSHPPAATPAADHADARPVAAAGAGNVVCSPVAAAVTAAAAAASADEGDSASCITFIDYEYSGFNPMAYDIANHWCEWAADYHTEEPHVLDFSKLPDPQQQYFFVDSYLRVLLTKLGVQVPPMSAADAAAAAAAAGNLAGSAAGASAAASPEPPNLSSLAGFKLTVGLNPGSSGKSEAAWSTLSSMGGSVLSFPETDAGWETASQSSVVTTKSNRTEGDESVPAAAAAAASGGADSSAGVHSSSKIRPSSKDLSDVWCWLEYAADLTSSNGSSGGCHQLSSAAWQQLVAKVVAAADAYMAASHLLWALWGVIQAKVSDVDFDFTGYGQQRWRMYLQTRPAELAKQ